MRVWTRAGFQDSCLALITLFLVSEGNMLLTSLLVCIIVAGILNPNNEQFM